MEHTLCYIILTVYHISQCNMDDKLYVAASKKLARSIVERAIPVRNTIRQVTHFAGESGYIPDRYSVGCRDTPYRRWPGQSVVKQGD